MYLCLKKKIDDKKKTMCHAQVLKSDECGSLNVFDAALAYFIQTIITQYGNNYGNNIILCALMSFFPPLAADPRVSDIPTGKYRHHPEHLITDQTKEKEVFPPYNC